MSSDDTNPLPDIPQSDSDKAWREGLPPELQPVAERHGRELFATVLNINSANAQLAILFKWAQGNHSASAALQTLAVNLNQLASAFLATKGWPAASVAEVSADLQRVAALAGERRLIVPGRVH